MNTRSVIKTLSHLLEKDFEVVARPDHPFLFLGPDLLVGTERRIAGLFVVHATESARPDELLARMAMARLAYPNNFQAFLIVPNALARGELLGDVMHLNFDVVIKWPDAVGLRKRLTKAASPVADLDALPKQRHAAYSYAEVLFSASLGAMDNLDFPRQDAKGLFNLAKLPMANEPARPWLVEPTLAHMPRQNQARLHRYDELLVGFASLLRSSTVQPTLTRFGRQVFTLDHQLDRGVAYRQRKSHNALIVDRRPIHRYDHDKWLRASAFAGFALLPIASQDHIEKQLQSLKKEIDKVL